MITARIIGIVLGYIFGLFPSGSIVGRRYKTDLRKEGSGNTGMTNSIRVLGWKAGVLVFIGDCAKCSLAMFVMWLMYRHTMPEMVKLLELYAGLGAVLGHNYPFYAKFKGGKGIACSIGIVFGTDIRMVPICTLLFFLAVVPTGFMSLGSMGILVGYFVQVVVFGQLGWLKLGAMFRPEFYIVAAILAALGFWQHRENIKRLAKGEENKFVPKKKSEEK